MSVNNMIKKRLAAMENLENKDENDISREIKGWVLNKGVGESVLYKAARLDYVVSLTRAIPSRNSLFVTEIFPLNRMSSLTASTA
jgi:hypothetical protein